jgi:hypothetical protein
VRAALGAPLALLGRLLPWRRRRRQAGGEAAADGAASASARGGQGRGEREGDEDGLMGKGVPYHHYVSAQVGLLRGRNGNG